MISRDGNNKSLWQKTSSPYKSVNRPDKKNIYDVIIIGGGITGITTGLLLQQSGFNCLVIEAQNLCFGTTGGTTAHINTLLDTPYNTIAKNFGKENASLVASAAKEAVALIRQHIRKYAIACDYESADAYLFSTNKQQTQELEDIVQATKEAGVNMKYTKKIPLAVDFEKAAVVTGQAKFHPVSYVYALAQAFENHGGVILQQARVTGIEENDTIAVQTNNSRYLAKKVIHATHTPLGVNLVHLRCQPFRSYAIAVHLRNNAYPDDLIYDMYDPYHYYRTQEINGKKYLVAGGFDHKTGKKENEESCLRELEEFIRKKFNVSSIYAKWSSQFFEPADGLPYIGSLPGHGDSMYVAAGFGGNGMTYSHVAALTIRAILKNQESPYISLFNPNRIKPVAGFKHFISHNVAAAKNIISKIFPGEKIKELEELKPGEGKVLVYEKEKLAIYKDAEGNISAVNPSCTHLQCTVSFNDTELSWDCPCHGARYSITGEVLNAPTSMPLEKIQLGK